MLISMPYNPLNLDPQYGLPSFRGSDGTFEQGDTCANLYTLAYCGALIPNDSVLLGADGWPLRSPDATRWYGRAGRCSRDQLTPYLLYYATKKSSAKNCRNWKLVVKALARHAFVLANNHVRNHVYENELEHIAKATPDVLWKPQWKLPDFLGPDIWAILVRGMAHRHRWLAPVLHPVLMTLDMHNLTAVALTAYQAWRGTADIDQRNLALKVHFAAHQSPTIVSKLTYWMYKKLKPAQYFVKWWSKPGEPQIAPFMAKLFV